MALFTSLSGRCLLRGIACCLLGLISTSAIAQNAYYEPVELWGIVGEPFDESIVREIRYPGPQSIGWDSSNGPLPPGLVATEFAPEYPLGELGVRIQGTPTTPGLHTYTLRYNTYRVSGTGTLTLILFRNAADRDAVSYFTDLMKDSSGADYYYWAALRGYMIGVGIDDEGLALYSYYVSLGDYYYVAYVGSPQWAAFYYWYYRGLAAYYYYDRHGDTATAQGLFVYYVSLANGSL